MNEPLPDWPIRELLAEERSSTIDDVLDAVGSLAISSMLLEEITDAVEEMRDPRYITLNGKAS